MSLNFKSTVKPHGEFVRRNQLVEFCCASRVGWESIESAKRETARCTVWVDGTPSIAAFIQHNGLMAAVYND